MSNFRARKGDGFVSQRLTKLFQCASALVRDKRITSFTDSPALGYQQLMAWQGQDPELGQWCRTAVRVIISENPDSNLLKQAIQRNGARIGHFPEMDSMAILCVVLHMNSLKIQRRMEGKPDKAIRSQKLKDMMGKKFENLRFNRGIRGHQMEQF